MSLLTGTKTTAKASPFWAERVHVQAMSEPWWSTASVQAVAEVVVSGLLTVLVYVCKARSGRLYVAMPSTKRGEEWIPLIVLDDKALAEAIESAVLRAYEEAER